MISFKKSCVSVDSGTEDENMRNNLQHDLQKDRSINQLR